MGVLEHVARVAYAIRVVEYSKIDLVISFYVYLLRNFSCMVHNTWRCYFKAFNFFLKKVYHVMSGSMNYCISRLSNKDKQFDDMNVIYLNDKYHLPGD